MWRQDQIEKARSYELARLLVQHLTRRYPWLINCNLQQIIGRLTPVRRSAGDRMIRFYGRDCEFLHKDQALVAGFLLDQFQQGVGPVDQHTIVSYCDLPAKRQVSDVLKNTSAYQEGLITSECGLYRWQLPPDENEKPDLVVIPPA